ncbi:hypothetical protein JTE90_017428 [Oedothorax gibbosus]|uniref:Exosome complex component 10 homolog n=1 Tax=Oedothorax gibbosus TaxID=931172 RepID=A0AAV6U8C3_9ARAC|nr:hypothetical protein JTE90_017428 [Oedothorax gibbosus]
MEEEHVQEIPPDTNENGFFAAGFKDANSYSQAALRSILLATKASNDLPSADNDFDYYSTFTGFREVMFRKRQAILALMSSLVQGLGIREEFQGREEKFDLLVDVNDVILENVSSFLDEASGLKKSEEELVLAVKPSTAINTSWNKRQFHRDSPKSYQLITAKNVSRPQLTFKDKVDNSSSLFVPVIRDKPNSVKPLAITLEKDGDREEYCHPYEWEIERFQPPEDILQNVEPMVPKPLEETPLVMVTTEEQLKELCAELKKQESFAVDLEHHSYRSFQGFTCLMQVSTRERDYLVDVLLLRSEMHLLNEVFTDPKIIKVLHGADMDVLWLQRDFGLYIVGLFDTGQAARVLHFAHLSLSHLLKHYCRVDPDKRFQLADWRVRPLPAEMIKYAREDTHYLLYVYDCMKNDLIAAGNDIKNLLISTFERSKVICAKRYQKPLYTPDQYLDLYKRSRKVLSAKQLYCLRELHAWRDTTARENDESINFVLPNHMLMQIAEALPREQQGILSCCNPIPPLVKQQLNELHAIILRANNSSIKQLEILDLQQKLAQTPKVVHHHVDLGSVVHCPHDIHHLEDKAPGAHASSGNTENLLPLITKEDETIPSLLKKQPTLSVLFKSKKRASTSTEQRIPPKVVETIQKLISPYERYKMTEELQSSQPSSEIRKETNEAGDSTADIEEVDLADTSVVEESVEAVAEEQEDEMEEQHSGRR